MKNNTLRRLFRFLFVLIAVSTLLSVFYSRIIMRDSILSRIERQFYDSPKKFRYLILGDSHSQTALQPNILGNSFNYSALSGSYIHTYYRLKHIFDNNIKDVESVILPLELHSFSSVYYSEGDTSWYWKKYFDYIELGKISGNLISNLLLGARAHAASYFNRGEHFLRFISPEEDEVLIQKGHVTFENSGAGHERLTLSAKERVQHHFYGRNVMDKTMVIYFSKILELCRKHHVAVVLVRYPVSQPYFQEVAGSAAFKAFVRRDYEDFVNLTLQEFPDVRYLDFIDLYFERDEFFLDADHLNRKGSIAFTERFLQMIQDLN